MAPRRSEGDENDHNGEFSGGRADMSENPKSPEPPEADAVRYQEPEMGERDPIELYEEELKSAFDGMPRVNIVVTGKTGVGKSTLVNAIFRKPLAKTGVGQPVTEHIQEHSIPELPVRLYDTPGIELGRDFQAVAEEFRQLIADKLKGDPDGHIHLVWYCVNAESRRIEDFEQDLIGALAEDVAVILVLTQVLGGDDETTSEFVESIRALGLPIAEGVPIKTLATERRVGSHSVAPFGLDDLVELSYKLLPEEVRRAFTNAQGVALELKATEARKRVLPWAGGAAAAIGAAPIPVPDAGPLLALQMGMMARITVVMGVELDGETQRYLITKFTTSGGGLAVIGKAAASFIRKFIPGATTINATVAAALTVALGEAYIRLCTEMLRREAAGKEMPRPEMLDFLLSEFERIYKRGSE